MRIIRSAVLFAGLLAAAPAAGQNPFTDVAVPDPDARCKSLPGIATVVPTRGVLRDTLTMAPDTFRIDTTKLRRNVYNGMYNAPLYRFDPGDSVNILVRNWMEPIDKAITADQVAHTNQHFHGFVVTPLPTAGDNVVPVSIPNRALDPDSAQNRNNFFVPNYQSQGLMWYHPHPHGSTSPQVNGGLAGAMIVGDLLKESFPGLQRRAGRNERVMYIKDTKNDSSVTQLNILGNTCTRMTIRPGQLQFWRIANMSANTFVNLKLAGQQFLVLAWDGNPVMQAMVEDSLFLSPGTRVEFVVAGWARGSAVSRDSAELFSDAYQTGQNSRARRISLGWVVNQGDVDFGPPWLRPLGVDAALADSIANLVDEPDVNRDTIRFQSNRVDNKTRLQLNNASYIPGLLNTAVPYGQVQEWTLINETNFLHTFHIHQTDFVVTHINGVPQPDSVHLDNVFLGIHRRNLPSPLDTLWVGDTVVVRFKYRPIAAGPFVYHCHVLSHEDGGMMANMCVYNPLTGVTDCQDWFPQGPYPPRPADAARPAAQPMGAGAHAHGAGGDGGGRER